VRIYRGSDGTVLWETPGSVVNLTAPVVADVDADGHAEIVLGATDLWTSGGSHGIQVYGDDTWWPTWPIWNQYTYHVNNIHVDATIPAQEVNSWQDHNSYRCNAPTVPRAPDLTASWLRFDLVTPPTSLQITARIGNGGSLHAGIGLPVAFYVGDPAAGGTLLGTASTTQLH